MGGTEQDLTESSASGFVCENEQEAGMGTVTVDGSPLDPEVDVTSDVYANSLGGVTDAPAPRLEARHHQADRQGRTGSP